MRKNIAEKIDAGIIKIQYNKIGRSSATPTTGALASRGGRSKCEGPAGAGSWPPQRARGEAVDDLLPSERLTATQPASYSLGLCEGSRRQSLANHNQIMHVTTIEAHIRI